MHGSGLKCKAKLFTRRVVERISSCRRFKLLLLLVLLHERQGRPEEIQGERGGRRGSRRRRRRIVIANLRASQAQAQT